MLRRVVSQTPTEPASPRVLARARSRGDLPYAGDWTFALALLALALVGTQQVAAFVREFVRFTNSSFRAEGALTQALAALPGLLRPLTVSLGVAALAALLGVLAQRAPTLRAAPDSGAQEQGRGRPGHGRLLQGVLTGGKLLALGASLFALVYDGLQGWLETHARSASELLAITGRVLPAMLIRAAWVCVLLGSVELTVQYVARMQRLRMTRRQVQEEQRELAADPRLLSERRSRAAQDAPAQLAAADPTQLGAAALVITGSSGVVALEYSPEHGVPRVWLSATGPHALELLARSYNLDLPIISDELLASALSKLPLKAAVPSELHAHVASYLAAQQQGACE